MSAAALLLLSLWLFEIVSHYVVHTGLLLARSLSPLPSPVQIPSRLVSPNQMLLSTQQEAMASKRITQETFDAAVRENIEEFEMGTEEAIREAVEQFESQGRAVAPALSLTQQ